MLGKIEGRRRRRDRGWDGWVVSSTQWTRVWANSGRCWRTGKPGVLQSVGSQRVRHDWATEQQHGKLLQYSYRESPMGRGAGGLQSVVMQRAGHDWSNWACTSMHTTYCMIPYIWNFQREGQWFLREVFTKGNGVSLWNDAKIQYWPMMAVRICEHTKIH